MRGYSDPKRANHQNYNYYVRYTDGDGKRKCKWFTTHAEAKLFSEKGNIQAANAGLAVAGLPEEDKRAYLDAQKLLKPFNLSVLEAVKEYVNARERLIPYKKTLPECVKHFEKWNTIQKESTTLFKAYCLYMDDMKAKRKSARRIADQKSRLSRFVGDIGEAFIVGLITPAQCNTWLNSLKRIEQVKADGAVATKGQAKKIKTNINVSATTRNTYRAALSAFFNYCLMSGYCKSNPIEKVSSSETFSEEIEFYKVSKARAILNATKPLSDIRLYIAISLFAGLRRSEVERLDYSDIDLKAGTILLPARKTKTKQRRVVMINDTLKAWLSPYALEAVRGGNILQKNFRRRIEAFRKAHNIEWIENGLRHSFGTYFYALTSNIYETSKQMGNSPDVVESHYANQRITKRDAEAYFNIYPNEEGIIDIKKAIKTHSA